MASLFSTSDGAKLALAIKPDTKIAEVADKNPFEMSVAEQIAALRRVNIDEGWDLSEKDFGHLAQTAPEWPKGRHAYRSFRIRFGFGDEGVALTFERHIAHIKRVFGAGKFWRWEHLLSGKVRSYDGEPVECLRLWNGNHTHKQCVEWVIINLDVNSERDSVTAVRGPNSLADEGLVLVWLFPERVRAMLFPGCARHDDHRCRLAAWLLAGYELIVPLPIGLLSRRVPSVYFDDSGGIVYLNAIDGGLGNDSPSYVVPELLK